MKQLSILLYSLFVLGSSLGATQPKLVQSSEYKITSNIHLVNEIPYKKESYLALIEIPAGSTHKWEVNHISGNLEWEFKNAKPRKVNFLGYPGNYGFIPQTILDKEDGGDGDPLDIIVLSDAQKRGTVQEVKVIGSINLLDSGEQDDKIIAIPLEASFKNINSISDMMLHYPGSIQIIRLWFEGYKGAKIHFVGYSDAKVAKSIIEKAHKTWQKKIHKK